MGPDSLGVHGGGGACRLMFKGVSFVPAVIKSFMPLVNSRRVIGDSETEEVDGD